MGKVMDVVVAGGGAGLAAAIAARQRGLSVTVVDGANPPITKACGEGLLPDALRALDELGIELCEADGMPLRGIHFEDERSSVRASFSGRSGIGIRREVLHLRMVERAHDCGVTFLWNTPVTGLCGSGLVAGGNRIPARWVIGADGSRSLMRRWSGLENPSSRESRFAYRRHYRLAPWTDFTEIHWGEKTQAYVTPVSKDEICVVLISGNSRLRFDAVLCRFPRLEEQLSAAAYASSERGAITGNFRLNRVYRGNVALIGDASGSVDAITGEGLCLSFRQAQALADALVKVDLGQYQEAHSRLPRRPRVMGSLLLLLDQQTALRRRAMRTLESAPQLFERALAYHVGMARPLQIAAAGASLGWRFLTV